jgi:hypothetical protein
VVFFCRYLYDNALTGTIPTTVGLLTSLVERVWRSGRTVRPEIRGETRQAGRAWWLKSVILHVPSSLQATE